MLCVTCLQINKLSYFLISFKGNVIPENKNLTLVPKELDINFTAFEKRVL